MKFNNPLHATLYYRSQKTDLEVPPSHVATPSHHIHGQVSALNVSENEEERERDARFTRASVLIVVAFGLCHTLRLITNFIEMFCNRLNLPHVRPFLNPNSKGHFPHEKLKIKKNLPAF